MWGERREGKERGREREKKTRGGQGEREGCEGARGGNVAPMGRCFIMVVGVDL